MKIISMMPFLDDQSKDELVNQILNKEVDLKGTTTGIYPFLNDDQLYKLFKASVDQTIDLDYTTMLPFLNDESMDYLVKSAEASNWESVKLDRVLPFLKKDKISELFKETLKHYKQHQQETTEEKEEAHQEEKESE